MNYFAHGRRFVHVPYFLAGTAVPDWLGVVDRKVRARAKHAVKFVHDADPRLAAVARGIIQHHEDDRWFHQTRAFAELSLAFTVGVRDLLPPDDGLRPSFVGHILVELLLDAQLIRQDPRRLADYYQALGQIDPAAVGAAVNRLANRPTDCLAPLIPRFLAERFLYDYAEDGKLLTRLNHVMRRVKLAPLPESVLALFPQARRQVALRQDELLGGEIGDSGLGIGDL
jgi:hypothetical protein